MRSARWVSVALLAMCIVAGPASAAVIADYRAEFQGPTPATGWDYLWNATGPIGTATNYQSLVSNTSGTQYNYDGLGGLPRAEPAAYTSLNSTGSGHPGRGSTQNYSGSGNTLDRYPIAAYTIQTGEAGFVRITNSALSVGSASSGGVEARVYINDTLATSRVTPAASSRNFNSILGQVNVGDTIYVGLGPNTHDGSDSFYVGYKIETFTDPSLLFWDADGTAPVDGGTGNWDTANARWADTSGTYTTWNNSGLNAVFGPAAGTVTLTEPITARSLTFAGTGYTLAGANTLTLTSAGSGGPGPAHIDANAGTANTIAVPMASSVPVNKVGDGTVTLTGNNTFSSVLRAAGGNLVLGGTSTTTASQVKVGITANWGAIGGGSGTLTIQDTASLTTALINMGENYNPVIAGMTALINQTGGTVTITSSSGENAAIRIGHWPNETSTYNLSGGVLNITGADQDIAIGTDGTGIFNQTGGEAFTTGVMVNHRNANGSGTLTVTGGTLNIGARGIQTAGGPATVNLGGSGIIKATTSWASSLDINLTGSINFNTNGNTITLSGDLGSTGGFNKKGTGTLVLTGNNSYGGFTSIQQGTVNISTDTALGSAGSGADVWGGAFLELQDGITVAGEPLRLIGGTPTLRNVSGNNTFGGPLTIGYNSSNGTIRSDSGTLTLNSTAPIAGESGSGDEKIRVLGAGNVVMSCGIDLDAAGDAPARLDKADGGTLTLTGSNAYLFNALNVGDGTVNLTGSPTVNIGGGLTVGTTQIGLGTAAVDATLNIDSGAVTTVYIVMGNASGGAAVVGEINQTGGTVTTTGATAENNGVRLGHYAVGNNTYNLIDGTLTVGNSRDLSAATDGTGWFHQTGGTLNVQRIVLNKRPGSGGDGTVTLEGGTANIGSGGIITDSDPSKATLEYGGQGAIVRATATFSSPLDATLFGADANAVTFDTNGNTITLDGALGGLGGLNKAGAGTLLLTGTNAYAGDTMIAGGTLGLTGSIANSPVITVGPSATFDVSGVSGGFTLGAGQTLTGAGTVIGSVAVDGTVSPGMCPGTLTTGSETWNGGGSYTWEINQAASTQGTDPGWDWLDIQGTLGIAATPGNPFEIDILSLALDNSAAAIHDFDPNLLQSWTLATATGGVTGFDPDKFVLDDSGFQGALPGEWFTIGLGPGGGSVVLTYAVPEPTSLSLLGLGLLGAIARRRRRR